MKARLSSAPLKTASRAARRIDERKLAILRAAATVFRTRGFAAAGMREIAAAADLPTANLYHYFKGKEELLYFCQDRALARMMAEMVDARASKSNITDQLRRVLVFHALCIMDDVEGSIAHLETASLPAARLQQIIQKRDLYERAIRQLIVDGVAAGEFACADPTVTTRAILGALNWTARWFRADGRQSARDVAGELADYLMNGLRPAPARSAPVRAARRRK